MTKTQRTRHPLRKTPVSLSLKVTCHRLYTKQHVKSKDENCLIFSPTQHQASDKRTHIFTHSLKGTTSTHAHTPSQQTHICVQALQSLQDQHLVHTIFWGEGLTRMKLLHLQKLKLLGDKSITTKKAQFFEQQAKLCHYILQKGRMFTVPMEFQGLRSEWLPTLRPSSFFRILLKDIYY